MLTEDEAIEILEAALAAKAAERATDDDVAVMTATCERMRSGQDLDDRDEYSALNRKLHDQVRQATLTKFVDSLLFPLVLRQCRDMDHSRPKSTVLQEHEAILASIRARAPPSTRSR